MELVFEITAELNTTKHGIQNDSNSDVIFLSLSGKQDYKKTKSVLKATRLKAEAKKNSSGFRVRLSWTYFLFHITEVCYLYVFFFFCLSALAHLPVCLPANHLLSICLSVCLSV